MSEIFDGARARFARAIKTESKVNVRVTLSFEPNAVAEAVKWNDKWKYTHRRDGELGQMLLSALASGAIVTGDWDFDLDEEFDVDVEDE